MDKIAQQVDGIMPAEFGTRILTAATPSMRLPRKTGGALAVSLKQSYMLNALLKDVHSKVPALEDDGLLIFRKSKKRYDKWETGLIDRFDGGGKIFDVFEVSK